MSQWCLSYDLKNKPRSNYSKIYQTLGLYEHQRLQKSIWLLNTTKSSDEIMNDFRHCVDHDDRFAVFPIDQNLLNILKE
ncbi:MULTISPECIES: CRISPR-associated protein Cas2 [unclassified Acinetobacter]|uniref:CRISPR-associated protein Cas2 n=1 Tax=unclassified Acinetobacter TaxID=196816 RepID=UPI0015D3A614|nr:MULTISPECIES: CRISPR-associated protein Cas2 [unclassified Acinetobacter]UUS61443.1 CRISPR-associated protein Cas2 [Acinetobacter sp. YH16056_T]